MRKQLSFYLSMSSTTKIQEITACAFIHKNGKLFVAKRASTKSFLPDTYELPGGHVEFGETMEEALKREIQEEFGFEIKVGNPFYTLTYTWSNNTKHAVEVVYFATMVDPNHKIQLDPIDHSEFHWITKSDISNFFEKDDLEGQAAKRGFNLLDNKKN